MIKKIIFSCFILLTLLGTAYGRDIGTTTVVGDLTVEGNTVATTLECTSVDTGQGPKELYSMNQDVETDDSVTFASIISNGLITINDNLSTEGIVGVSSFDSTTENTIEATIFDADAQTVTGLWTNSNNIGRGFGSAILNYDSTDSVLELKSSIVRIGDSGTGVYVDGDGDLLVEDELETEYAFINESLTIGNELTIGGILYVGGSGNTVIDNPSGGVLSIDGELILDDNLTSDGSGNWYYNGDELGTGSGGATTSSGGVTYVTNTTDDFAIGGTTSSASFFFDEGEGNLAIDGSLTTGGEAAIKFVSTGVSAEIQVDGDIIIDLTTSGYVATMHGDTKVDGDLTVTGTIYQDIEGSGASGSVVTYDHLNDLEQASMYQYQTETLDKDFEIKRIEPIGVRENRVLKLYSGAFKQIKLRLERQIIINVIIIFWIILLTIIMFVRKK